LLGLFPSISNIYNLFFLKTARSGGLFLHKEFLLFRLALLLSEKL